MDNKDSQNSLIRLINENSNSSMLPRYHQDENNLNIIKTQGMMDSVQTTGRNVMFKVNIFRTLQNLNLQISEF